MDLTQLLARIPKRTSPNAIFTYEQDRIVSRSHQDLYSDAKAAAVTLRMWGIRPGMRVGIRAPNCYEWMVYDLALIEVRAVSVAFTDDFRDAAPEALIARYGLSLLLLGGEERGKWPQGGPGVAYVTGENRDVRVVSHSVETVEQDFACPWLVFSSGSAGGLKGLRMNRRGVDDWVDSFAERVSPRSDDRMLLFLPMSNFQQRPMYYAALWYGVDLIICTPLRLFMALKELCPPILIAPPAFYEVFESRFLESTPAIRGLARGVSWLGGKLPSATARQWIAKCLFRRVYEALGGRMRFMVTGMAPIKRSTLDLFALMRLPLFETYGLVECGSITLNAPGACRIGSVGRPLRGVSLTLKDDGEIVVRRENAVAAGYFECAPGENERTFLAESQVATGDVGYFDEEGYLHLSGRKKEMIITGGGEKIHPETVEAEIDRLAEVSKSVVFFPDGAGTLTAVVSLRKPGEASAQERINAFIERWNEKGRVLEVGHVIFTEQAFSRENGFLRPNLKLDRKRIQEHFRGEAGVALGNRRSA